MVISANEEQKEKQLLEIEVIDDGIEICCNEEQ